MYVYVCVCAYLCVYVSMCVYVCKKDLFEKTKKKKEYVMNWKKKTYSRQKKKMKIKEKA